MIASESAGREDYDYYENESYGYEIFPEDEEEDDIDSEYNVLTVLGTYSGQRNSKNERHGFGKAILPNGDAYVGSYKNGLRHGYGTYQFKNGATYQGCYKEGLRNGKGVMRYPDNTRYEGYWLNNLKHGEGVFKHANNDKFSGSWMSDKKHGLGTYTFCKTGAVLKGMWFEGKKVKNFQIFFPTNCEKSSGFTFYGTWDSDESVTGNGYYVFENLKCMQKGVHVVNPQYRTTKSNVTSQNNRKFSWFSNEILPIVNNMLPRLPVAPSMMTTNRQSSCEIKFPTSGPAASPVTSTSRMEMYEHKDELWYEMEEFESGELGQGVNENSIGDDKGTEKAFNSDENIQ